MVVMDVASIGEFLMRHGIALAWRDFQYVHVDHERNGKRFGKRHIIFGF
jgi:hypothetical protein